ncbi:MAG: hypothetical protein IJY28_00610 [Clostridia bacterium]|nr:hypothetical protein [Clostridia bacterium]
MYKPKMKLSTVIRIAIERSLEQFVVNDSISAEDMFDDLRDMYRHYESEVSMDELEAEE